MKIYVKLLVGKTFTVEAEPSDLIGTLKQKIQLGSCGVFDMLTGTHEDGIPPELQHLVSTGDAKQSLGDDGRTLSSYGLDKDGCTITCVTSTGRNQALSHAKEQAARQAKKEAEEQVVLTLARESLQGSTLLVSCTDLGGEKAFQTEVEANDPFQKLRADIVRQSIEQGNIEFAGQLKFMVGDAVVSEEDNETAASELLK